MYSLEKLSAGKSVIHRLHPAVKILATFAYLLTLLSFNRYKIAPVIPFLFYPCILIALADIPVGLLVRRTAVALPFCLFAGVSNLVFERGAAFTLGGISISFGLLSFCVLLLRTLLCVSAVLLLAGTTPIQELSSQLRRFRVPAVFVALLEICYRYIALLATEAHSMRTAYILRCGAASSFAKGIDIRDIGSFIGHLFLRCADRSERVYAAMKCRGYSLDSYDSHYGNSRAVSQNDIVFLAAVCLPCLLFRFVSVPSVIGSWLF
jgi:cobalt/nickel transport system permease protein